MTMCKAHKVTHIKNSKNIFITSRAADIIHDPYYIHGP